MLSPNTPLFCHSSIGSSTDRPQGFLSIDETEHLWKRKSARKVWGKKGREGTTFSSLDLFHSRQNRTKNRFFLFLVYHIPSLQLLLVCVYAKECIQLNGAALFCSCSTKSTWWLPTHSSRFVQNKTLMVSSFISIIILVSCSFFCDLASSLNYQPHNNLIFFFSKCRWFNCSQECPIRKHWLYIKGSVFLLIKLYFTILS